MSGCNGNQNGFVLAAGGRSTSRVLAPPGGHSSISFGSCSPQQFNPPPPRNQNNSHSLSSSRNTSLPPKPVRGTGTGTGTGTGSGGGRNPQGIGAIEHRDGDSLDRIMQSSSQAVPGLESHYSKSSERRQAYESTSTASNSNSNSASNGSTFQRGAQRSMGRSEYAEELRRQIETKKELDKQSERSQRRAYSGDFTNSSSSLPLNLQGGRHNGPQKALAANEYADSLRAQIAHKNSLNSDSEARSNPRNQVKSYSAPEPTRGKGNVPPGGHSTFSMKWE